ncbi:UNVERIFIED_CONTAM: hypothetical protein FKN15_071695 [Acipenser sinensis]
MLLLPTDPDRWGRGRDPHCTSPPPPTDRHLICTPWAAFLHINGELGRPPAGQEQSTPPRCQTVSGTCRLRGYPFTPLVTSAMRSATSPEIVPRR